ncbi:hypothetical protein E4U61_003416, partial [Claviceps capensis]
LRNSEIVSTKLLSGQMRGRFPDQDEDIVALTAAPECEQWLVWICGWANAEQHDRVITQATIYALPGNL